MKRKGFVYTLYALIVLNLVFMVMLVPLETSGDHDTVSGVSEINSFARSVFQDMERGGDAAGGRSVIAVSSEVLDEGEPIQSSQDVFPEVFLNGTREGESLSVMEGTSFMEWISSMEEQAESEEFILEMYVEDMSVHSEGFEVIFEVFYDFHIHDSSISGGFDLENLTEEVHVTVENLEDPMHRLRTDGAESKIIDRCEEGRIGAEKLMEGTEYRYNTSSNNIEDEWFTGEPVFPSGDLEDIHDPGKKVLFVEDLCDFEPESLSEFGGVVSESLNDPMGFCGSNENLDAYIGGINSIEVFDETTPRAVMDENAVWENFFAEMVEENCFFGSENGPDFLDRLEDNKGSGGFASFVDVPSLPSDIRHSGRSSVDHLYFEDEGQNIQKLKGMSDTERYQWFRLDEAYAEMFGVEELLY